jgi:hypothetical protein
MIRLLCQETYCHPSAEHRQEDLSVTGLGQVIKAISRFVADKRYFTPFLYLIGRTAFRGATIAFTRD